MNPCWFQSTSTCQQKKSSCLLSFFLHEINVVGLNHTCAPFLVIAINNLTKWTVSIKFPDTHHLYMHFTSMHHHSILFICYLSPSLKCLSYIEDLSLHPSFHRWIASSFHFVLGFLFYSSFIYINCCLSLWKSVFIFIFSEML
jgi:hypothetical protein